MKTGIEIAVEDFFLKVFRTHPSIKGIPCVHFDEERKALPNEIVAEAIQGNHQLAGFGGYDVEVTITFRSPIRGNKTQRELVAGAIQETVYDGSNAGVRGEIARKCGFSDLLIKDESTSDRQNESNLRKRTWVFPVQAKMAL